MKKEYHCAREVFGAVEVPFSKPFRLAEKKGKGVYILHCGFSPEEALKLYKERFGAPGYLVDSGSCGSLKESIRPGDILIADRILGSGEPFVITDASDAGSGGLMRASLIEVAEPVCDSSVRSSLAEQADICTMESYRVCRAAMEMGSRFVSLRVVTDSADSDMKDDFRRNFRSSCIALYRAAGEFLNDISH